ncbi:MAG: acyltransferase family protein [Aquihabitans sp.]
MAGDLEIDQAKPAIAHIPALDGLRGAAVAGVLVFHLGHLRGGYLGVDLFFVLSGFLITSLLLAEHRASGRIDLRAFFGRRARRLMPALWLLLIGVAVYAVVVARPIDLPGIRADALATIAYAANWHTILGGASYWNISLAPSPLQHTWSLAIEEQFYVVWPLLFVALVARARRSRTDVADLVLRLAVVGAIASAAGLVWLHHGGASDTRVYEGTDTRAAALLLGVALAAWRVRSGARSQPAAPTTPTTARYAAEAAGVAAAVVLGLLWVRLDGQSPWLYRGGLAAASVLAVVVVATASRAGSPVVGRAFAVAPLRWLGAISYGLYLWHWPVYQGLDALNGRFPGLGRRHLESGELVAAKLGLSLVVALASFVIIEQPIRRGRIATRFGPAAVGAGLATAVVAVVLATSGGVQPDLIEAPTSTRLAHVDGGPVVWVAGDSVALSVASRLYADPPRYGVNPLDHTRIACSIAASGLPARSFADEPIQPPSCQQYALDGIDEAKPDIVFLLTGARPNDYVQLDRRWVRACDPAYDAHLRDATVDLLRRFRATGAQVVVGTVPHSGAGSFPIEGAEPRVDCANRVIESLPAAVDGVHVIDLNQLLCPTPGGPCIEELNGDPVRTDGLHFDRGPGGDRVVDWIAAQILRAADDPADPTGPIELASDLPPRTVDWLQRVNQQAVGRGMDPTGTQFWGERLVAGAPRVDVTRQLVDSVTWRRQRVRDAFRRWLDAVPTDAELTRWEAFLGDHSTSELDLSLATSDRGYAAAGATDRERAEHLAVALGLPPVAADHFARLLDEGASWPAVVRHGYFSRPASDRRMTDLAPRSRYTPDLEALVAEFLATGDERTPLAKALATLA